MLIEKLREKKTEGPQSEKCNCIHGYKYYREKLKHVAKTIFTKTDAFMDWNSPYNILSFSVWFLQLCMAGSVVASLGFA